MPPLALNVWLLDRTSINGDKEDTRHLASQEFFMLMKVHMGLVVHVVLNCTFYPLPSKTFTLKYLYIERNHCLYYMHVALSCEYS